MTGVHTYNRRLQVHKDGSWDVFSGSGLTEKGIERIIPASDGLVTWHGTIGLDTVLKAVQFPACISDLDPGLTNVDGNTLTLKQK